MEIIFYFGTKSLGLAQNLFQFQVRPKYFVPFQNILGHIGGDQDLSNPEVDNFLQRSFDQKLKKSLSKLLFFIGPRSMQTQRGNTMVGESIKFIFLPVKRAVWAARSLMETKSIMNYELLLMAVFSWAKVASALKSCLI